MATITVIQGDQSGAGTDETRIGVIEGDGGAAEVETNELMKFKAEMEQISKDAAYSVNERRFAAEETRFNIWEGQSPDGRKHTDAMNGAKPFPFEGASDGRIRLADMLVNESVLLLVMAALRSLPKVKGLELMQEGQSTRMQTVLKWVIDNQLAGEYFREITKIAQWQEADSPAGSVLGVYWQQEYGLKLVDVDLKGLEQLLTQTFGLKPEELQTLEAQLADPGQDKESAEFLMEVMNAGTDEGKGTTSPQPSPSSDDGEGEEPELAEVTMARARTMVKELRKSGKTSYPCRYLRVNRPRLVALRMFDHIFYPANSTDPRKCRVQFVREWLSEVDVRERQVSMGYSADFVEEVLKHEAQTGFPLYKRDPVQGDFAVARQESKETFKGLYEVITAYYRAVNVDNIPAIYTMTFHHAVDFAAKDRELLDYAHGEYPHIFFTREVLTERLWDARGIPELVATDQEALKLLHDSFLDNVMLGTVPPLKVPRRRSKLDVVIGPLKIIKEDRPGDVSWMQPPQYPAGNEKATAAIMMRTNEYFGRVAEGIMPQLTQMHQTVKSMWFLANLTEALMQLLQLIQQYMPDQELAMITGSDGMQVARSTEQIQGKFGLQLTFNANAMNLDYLKSVFELVGKYVLPTDTVSTIQRDKLVQWMMSSIDANLAQDVLIPVQSAQQKESDDEDANLSKIMAGVEPPMQAEGLNFGLRLQRLQQNVQKNPEILQKLQQSPNSMKIFQARVEFLQNQVQQLKNAQIGRQVGQPALDPSPKDAPAWAQPGAGISGAPGQAPMTNIQ